MRAPAGKQWLTELTSASFRTSNEGRLEFAFRRLLLINDVAYVRAAQLSWLQWAVAEQRSEPSFNWVAIHNFNAAANSRAFAIGSSALQSPEALMLAKDGHVVRCDQGDRRPLVYVSFLEVAPWNKSAVDLQPRLRGVGTAMIRAASDLSMQRGYGGRVGLHSVRTAEAFYRRLGFEALECPNEYNEIYFELSESGARALLQD